jgi:hypothetical protein
MHYIHDTKTKATQKLLKAVASRRKNYNKLMDCLNLIDEQAEQGGTTYEESVARKKAYDLVADFIDKYAR